MKEVIYNKDNVLEKDINNTIKRVKIILINSKKEIILAFSDNVYHFIGGHVEENETLNEAIIREVKEETGITLKNKHYIPFYKMTKICKDYPQKGINNSYEYYYYEIICDKKPNLNNTNYTEEEKNDNFQLRYTNLDNIEQLLINTLTWGEKNKIMATEMLEVLEVYKNI